MGEKVGVAGVQEGVTNAGVVGMYRVRERPQSVASS